MTTIHVPAGVVCRLLDTITRELWPDDAGYPPEIREAVTDAFNAVFNATRDDVAIDATSAWWLQYASDGATVYDLDESADETYDHPAVSAQTETLDLVLKHAPEVDDECGAISAAYADGGGTANNQDR